MSVTPTVTLTTIHLYMYKLIITVIAGLITYTSFAQKPSNSFIVSYTQKYYLNKASVDNDGQPNSGISAKNSFNPAVGLDFERTTKYNVIFNVGLDYGIQTHDFVEHYDLTNFDPEVPEFNGMTWENNIKIRTHYISPRILVGYNYKINSDLALVGKCGLSWALYFDGYEDYKENWLMYSVDSSHGHIALAAVENIKLGDDKKDNHNYFDAPIPSFEFYLGVERSVKMGHIKRFSAGIMATRAGNKNYNGQFVQFNTMKNIDDVAGGSDWYRNHNIAIGLKLGVGLW